MKIDLFTFLNLLTITTFVVLIAIIIQKPLNTAAKKRFFLTVCLSGLWVVLISIMDESTSLVVYSFFTKANFAAAAAVAGAMAIFSIHYPDNNPKLTVKKETLLWLPILLVVILSFTDAFINPNIFRQAESGRYYLLYIFILVIYFIVIAAYQLTKKFRLSKGIERSRLAYILVGYLITILIELGESVYQNIDHSFPINLARFITFLTIIFSVFTTYAIFRYRFLDVQIIIKRGLVRVLSFSVIFGAYLFFVLSLKGSFSLKTQSEQTTFLIISILVVVFTIEPIRKLIHHVVDRAFESSDQNHQEAQKKIRLTLRSQQTVENLLFSMSKIMKDLFEIETVKFFEKTDEFLKVNKETNQFLKSSGHIIIPEELPYRFEEEERFFSIHQELEKTDYSALVPLGQDDIFMGCIVLGKRKNHSAFTVEEVCEMKQLQDQFTEALWNARLYQQAIARIKI